MLVGLIALPIRGVCDTQTTTQTLFASISPTGKVAVAANINMRSSDTRFGQLAGSVTVSYWARTSAGGGGSITVQASEYTPSGGPVASSVSYTCSGATLGVACSGAQVLSTST